MGDRPVGFRELGDFMRAKFGPAAYPLPAAHKEVRELTGTESPAKTFDWDVFAESVLADPPLSGVSNSLERALAALSAGQFVVLMGAPGTGKTVLAEYLCNKATECGVPSYRI